MSWSVGSAGPAPAAPLTLRADSGFWSAKVIGAAAATASRFSITVRQTKTVTAAIAAIAEARLGADRLPRRRGRPGRRDPLGGDRLIVRRTRLSAPRPQLWPDWRYHAFVTDRAGTAVELDADHRRHAVVELAIRDLKEGAGLRHCPSGRFLANAAWLVLATLAHNLLRWIATLGLGAATAGRRQDAAPEPAHPARPAHPLRPPMAAAPARRLAMGPLLHHALARLRCIPYPT